MRCDDELLRETIWIATIQDLFDGRRSNQLKNAFSSTIVKSRFIPKMFRTFVNVPVRHLHTGIPVGSVILPFYRFHLKPLRLQAGRRKF
jgi:hypothetical protein